MQSDDALAERVQLLARFRLEQAGLFVRVGADMHEWAARTIHRQRFANPQYRELYRRDASCRCAMIFAGDGELIGSITWRTLETADYVAEFESGRLWYDDPPAAGFAPIETGLAGDLRIAGHITSRGGIHSYRGGLRLSWWLTIFPMAASLAAGAAYNAGVPLRPIAEGGLPGRFYGYRHQVATLPIRLPFMDTPDIVYIAWSRRAEVADELARRCRGLETTRHQELGAIVDALEAPEQP